MILGHYKLISFFENQRSDLNSRDFSMIKGIKIGCDRLEIDYDTSRKPGGIRRIWGRMPNFETGSSVKLIWLYETYANDKKKCSVEIRVRAFMSLITRKMPSTKMW